MMFFCLPFHARNPRSLNPRSGRWLLALALLALALLGLLACQPEAEPLPVGEARFQLLEASQTGLDFDNLPQQTEDFNVFAYMYFFNGGGVATGDFNQDGLVDVFFTSNMDDNKLFLNRGELTFEDVTARAGLEGQPGWTSGASVVDLNGDGLLDIYVSQVGDFGQIQGANQLYICTGMEEGVPTFEDQAPAYGLDLVGFATQGVFFDYDLDGDLDLFQLNHTLHQNGTFGRRKAFSDDPHELAGDRLLRNDSRPGAPKFTDVTTEAGIYSTVIGYGLGVTVGDLNHDGWPDLYVGNDFHENDYLYLNQQDGTFREVLTEQMMHTSRFSMGVDMGDINNDGWSEIMSLDMLPSDPYILKTSLGEDGYNIFQFKIGYGYNHQYARNNLQFNQGNGHFSEIGLFADVYATDWSWAPLFMDMDHDGYQDLFVSNGIPRRMNDIDYVNFRLGDEDIRFKTENNHMSEEDLAIVEKMPQIKLPNVFFRNQGDLTFASMEDQIRHNLPSYSNGAAYADFDNDGDLDVVVNNIADKPFLYQNLTQDKAEENRNYLHLELEGPEQNTLAIGSRLVVKKNNQLLSAEHFPVRGYQSSVAPGLHLGVGDTSEVEAVWLIWPDRTYEAVRPAYNQRMHLSWREGLPAFDFARLDLAPKPPMAFEDVTSSSGLVYVHEENPFVEFNREALIPHMMSAEGPALAVGDVNGDGREDVFVGSSKRRRSALFVQGGNGTFQLATPAAMIEDSIFEDVDAAFADLDQDGDQDLLVAAGGNEYRGESEARKQRAYLNDGRGGFTRIDPFPEAYMTAACVLPGDVNGDGLLDVFLGGRAITSNYGEIPPSFLYLGQGKGEFKLADKAYCPGLNEVGLVKDGQWTDYDQDGDLDLLLAVEWEPLQVFENLGDRLEGRVLNELNGWWNVVVPRDFDGDGDIDILAGNVGKNSRLKPSREEPLRMYVNDFDENGKAEQLLTYYLDGEEWPFANHAELTKQLVSLKKRYLYAQDLAGSSLNEVFGPEKLAESQLFEANYFPNAYFERQADSFVVRPLPDRLQWAPMKAAHAEDYDGDGQLEVVLGGNFYENNIEMGRYDASYGHLLTGFAAAELQGHSLGKLAIRGQVRHMAPIDVNGRRCLLIARNDAALMLIRPTQPLPQ